MALPFFYISSYVSGEKEIILDEDNSRHVVQVLRMRIGESLQLTDGKGTSLTAVILDDHKKKCLVEVQSRLDTPPAASNVCLAVSLLKNASRFEWLLEKATEIGVNEIIPLLCDHTERQQVRKDRLRQILISAMLQSQQSYLPILQNPLSVSELIGNARQEQRFIAYCPETAPQMTNVLSSVLRNAAAGSRIILIGPEGDFSAKEVDLALQNQFLPVSLGINRLRTETAGVVAATLLCMS